ncbi:MAG: winged helix-turn-helix transcriptional regulator [Candidatus Thorarchaeota archaeon]|nr:winged helix-turn-helix transcriptional regulator [Candidatus Thorarchaeota archaeon]
MKLKIKKLLMLLVLSLVTSGVISFFFFNTVNTGSALGFQNMDLVTVSANNQVTLNVTILSAPISGGTTVLFPSLYTKIFSPTTIFTLMIGTVVMDRRSEEKAPKLREVVQSEIDEHPGIHLRELQRNIGCAMGALQYHVKHLESSGDVISCKVGNAKHFFPSDYSSDEQVLKLSALSRNPTIRTILSEIVDQGRVTQAELSRTMSLDKSLVSYYTNNLLKADVLSVVRVFGRERPLILSEWAHSIIQRMALV